MKARPINYALNSVWTFLRPPTANTRMLNPYYDLVVLSAGCLILIIASIEIGWLLGARVKNRGGANIFALEQSLIGLVALIIGFTFLMALTRFEARCEAVVSEANAIGTAALRARLLSEPYRTAARIRAHPCGRVQDRLVVNPSPYSNCALKRNPRGALVECEGLSSKRGDIDTGRPLHDVGQ
jgi:hypothetical protein